MKPIITAIALTIAILTVSADDGISPEITVSSSGLLGGGSFDFPSSDLPPAAPPLLKAGRRGTIRYSSLPAFSWPLGGLMGLDLNADGIVDFTFSGDAAATASIPPSQWFSFNLQCVESSQVLAVSNSVAALLLGTSISSVWSGGRSLAYPPPSWSGGSNVVNVTTFHSYLDEYWTGQLGEAGVGCIGVRFQAADGVHYGWIRVHLPVTSMVLNSGQPTLLDMAWETRPDTPIPAGVVSSARGVKEFAVWFQNSSGALHTDRNDHFSYGNAFLIGNTLRYELHLAGTFSNATVFPDSLNIRPRQQMIITTGIDSPRIDIHLPCNWQQDSNGVWSLTDCPGGLTVFFGDLRLNALQLVMLKRGKLRVDVGNGAAIGSFTQSISPEEMSIMIEIERERLRDRDTPSQPPFPVESTGAGISTGVVIKSLIRDPLPASEWLRKIEGIATEPPVLP